MLSAALSFGAAHGSCDNDRMEWLEVLKIGGPLIGGAIAGVWGHWTATKTREHKRENKEIERQAEHERKQQKLDADHKRKQEELEAEYQRKERERLAEYEELKRTRRLIGAPRAETLQYARSILDGFIELHKQGISGDKAIDFVERLLMGTKPRRTENKDDFPMRSGTELWEMAQNMQDAIVYWASRQLRDYNAANNEAESDGLTMAIDWCEKRHPEWKQLRPLNRESIELNIHHAGFVALWWMTGKGDMFDHIATFFLPPVDTDEDTPTTTSELIRKIFRKSL
jgi:hypothetical protein